MKEQKQELKQYLKSAASFYTLGQIRSLILERYGVGYSKRQVQRLARQWGMYCYKPEPRDHRQPENAACSLTEKLRAVADVLGIKGRGAEKMCLGFADESSPQIQANTARLWSFERGLHKKVNTNRTKRNCFGFYALQGKSLISPIQRGNQETMLKMLEQIKQANREMETIIVIWDNHPAHLTAQVQAKARELEIVLVHLPAYSPNLNPIERIWKEVKKAISQRAFIASVQELEEIILSTFEDCSQKLSFARSWINNIFTVAFSQNPIPVSDMF